MSRLRRSVRIVPAALVLAVGLTACTGSTAPPSTSGTSGTSATSGTSGTSGVGQRYPDVVAVDPASLSATTASVAVTVSSPYDTEARYADAVRIRSADGAAVYGTLELTHDHAAEQPFTRTLTGLAIPAGTTSVVVEGHDQANGWGGGTLTVPVTG
jgi:hypothetical protein